MIPVQEIWDVAIRTGRADNDKERQAVKDVTNKAYFDLAGMAPWSAMRKTASLDFSTASDSTGLYLPSDLIGIEAIWDDADDFEYLPRDYNDVDAIDLNYRWYFSETVETEFSRSERGLTVIHQGSSLSLSTALSSSAENEYVKFGTELGYYKISSDGLSNPTFTPQYNGPSLDDAPYSIRPRGTKKLAIIDQNSTFIDDRTVTVHYWAYPQPLYLGTDPVLLPSAKALELMVLVEYIGTIKKRQQAGDRFRRELMGRGDEKGELAKCIAMNPDFGRRSIPRDKKFQPMFRGERIPYKNWTVARSAQFRRTT